VNNVFENDIYLNLAIRDLGKTDQDGNYLIEVEASNQNMDLQRQIVLQQALMETKDHFLSNGVISLDHLHKVKKADGSVETDLSKVIGEPIEVKTEGTTTIVTGKLYHTNESAKEIIKLLKARSTRVKASVGGIFPQVEKDTKRGIEKITHVLWNDLALTVSPVNNTVSPAYLVRSMNPEDFVKALTSGTATDHEGFSGGRVLIPEDVQRYGNRQGTRASTEYTALKEQIGSLIEELKKGTIRGKKAAIQFLVTQGLDKERANVIVQEIASIANEWTRETKEE
jgi:hypothetical protein